MPADEALAVSQLRRYGYDKRQAHLGKGAGDLAQRGRPGTNSTNRYDARLVRVVDFGRALSSMSNIDSTLVQLYYCDGESLTLVSQALGISVRTLSTRLPLARRALLNALEEFNLL
jgi:DNA-directed RNA polymerase specialized sigma24 family protein